MSTAAAAAASSDVQERQRNVLTGSSTRPDQYETPYAGTSDSAVQLSVSTGTPSARASNRPSDRRMSPSDLLRRSMLLRNARKLTCRLQRVVH